MSEELSDVGLLGSRSYPGSGEVLATFLLAIVLFLPGIANHDLWNPDEARYGEVAREMLVDNSPLIPRLNGEIYTQKPPLHFWLIMASSQFTGSVTEVSVRLSTLLAAAGSGVLVLLLGHSLYGARAGQLAALVFLTSGGILWQGRTAQIDMTLTFFLLLAMYGYLRSWLDDRSWGSLLFFGAAAFGTVAKGLPALLPPLLSLLVFLALLRDWSSLRRFRIGRGFLLYVSILLCWLGPATLAAGLEYPRALIFDQSLNRYVAATGHIRPWYYYAIPLFLQSLPFTPLLPAAWLALRRSEERARCLWPLLWVVVTTLFFSVSAGKRTVYVIALSAPVALVVAAGMVRIDVGRAIERRLVRAGLFFSALLFAIVPVTLWSLAKQMPEIDRFGSGTLPLSLAVTSMLAAGCVTALVFGWRGRLQLAVVAMATGFGVAIIVFAVTLLPRADVVKSSRELSQELLRQAAEDEPYALYPMPDAGFLFYSQRYSTPVVGEEALRNYAARPGTKWLIIERDELEALDPPLDAEEVARDQDWVEGHVLLRLGSDVENR